MYSNPESKAMEITAVCHVHSSWSYDGSWSLKDLAAKFRSRGHRIVMMTEHDRGFTESRLAEYREACAEASSEEILVVPGIEYSDVDNRVHVLVWGRVPFLGENLPTTEMLTGVQKANGIAVLAHPARKHVWKTFDPEWTQYLLGIELWNRKYDGWAPNDHVKDLLQREGAAPFVGLDFHTERQSFPLGMALQMEAAVEEDAIVDCFRAKRCHPLSFGRPITEGLVRTALPALKIAERGRRAAAKAVKRSGVFSR